MNELSIKEKASRYDEAIEVINKCKTDKYGCIIGVKPTDIFPELKESYDDRIRKEIIRIVDIWTNSSPVVNGIPSETLLAWLEKKGEQKPTDKVEPKFKVGYKIRRKTPSSFDTDMQVARIDKDYYICNHIGKFSSEVVPFSKQSGYELIEQKPAAWSEDDEIRHKNTLDDLEGFLEYIKQRPSHEISEYSLMSKDSMLTAIQKDIGWFKSLKERVQPQITWKPSDKQMELLKEACDRHWEPDGLDPLYMLYQDLKKIKEE